jgi:hypothetical protein
VEQSRVADETKAIDDMEVRESVRGREGERERIRRRE